MKTIFILGLALICIQCTTSRPEQEKIKKTEPSPDSTLETNAATPNNLSISSSSLAFFLQFNNKEELNKTFGQENISNTKMYFEEGTVEKQISLINPGTNKEVKITWDIDGPVISCNIAGSEWKARGISCGISLLQLEKINQSPIEFYGFGWDNGGFVVLGNGKLKPIGLNLSLTAPFDHPSIQKLMGDNKFSSENVSDELKKIITVGEISVFGLSND